MKPALPGKGLWRKTILTWLGAYALVVLVVVILVGLISTVTLTAVENSARIEQQTKLQNLRVNMDVVLKDVDFSLTLISADERLHVLSASTLPYTPFELYLLYDLNRSFPRYMAIPGPWESIYVYVKQGGYILSNNGKYDLPTAYKLLDYGLSAEAWQERLDFLKEKVYLSLAPASEAGQTHLEYWFPIGSKQENGVVLVARLNMKEFQNRLDAMRSYQEEIMVLMDERGRILYSTKPLDETLSKTVLQNVSLTDSFVEENGMHIGYVHSQLSGWIYVSVVPRDFLFYRSVYTEQIALALCVFLFVVGLLLSIMAVFQGIRPIKRLYDLVNKRLPEGEPTNVYGYLETSMRTMLKKDEEVQQTLHQYHNLLRHDVLSRLLNGANVEDHTIQSSGLQLRWNCFRVFVASCENKEDIFFGEYPDDAQPLALIAMSDVLQKTFSREADVYTIEQEDLIIGVMSMPEDFSEENLLALAEEGQRILKSQMGLSIILVLSDKEFGYENIAICYEHAREAWECEILRGQGHGALICYQSDRADGEYIMDLESTIGFNQAIMKGDFTQAKSLINKTLGNYLSRAHPSSEMARALMFTFVNTMPGAMRKAEFPFDEAFIQNLRPTQRMVSCNSIRELRTEMEQIIDEAERYVQQFRSEQAKYINGIKTFVQENYVDSNMNVSGIALEMGVSVPTLSKLFKKKTGMGLLNYINQTRIERACHLLTTTDLTLSEIAEKTGFLDSSTLIRNFKRTMGITPGKYKQQKGKVSYDR